MLLYTLVVFIVQAISFLPGCESIACFKCASINGNNPACEDPFHNNYSTAILENPCMAGRKQRNGVFPATACVKLTGYYGENRDKLTVRACALDSGSLTIDTEIVRVSHCGSFYFDDKYVKGCLQSCGDYDGCNAGLSLASISVGWNIMILVLIQAISNTLI